MELEFVDGIIQKALTHLKSKAPNGVPEIITFALYFDHEERAMSVCADTRDSSKKSIQQMNAFSFQYFAKAIENGDLTKASGWQANSGNSLSLGDFKYVNLARKRVPFRLNINTLFLEMAKGVIRHTESILEVCDQSDQIVFATSTSDEEVGLVWSPPIAPETP